MNELEPLYERLAEKGSMESYFRRNPPPKKLCRLTLHLEILPLLADWVSTADLTVALYGRKDNRLRTRTLRWMMALQSAGWVESATRKTKRSGPRGVVYNSFWRTKDSAIPLDK